MKTTSTLLLALALGLFTASTASAGLITDPLGMRPMAKAPVSPPPPPAQKMPAASVNVPAASAWLASVLADGKTVRLGDLFLNPEFFAAAHASGPEADALRGQIDWLMMSGVIAGFDGMDGSDDLRGNTTLPSLEPAKNTIILGGPGTDTIILGGPGTDTIILGGPGTDTIILGGPGTDTLKAPINGFVFGSNTYLK
jgi:Ca2+-binding RTX toxin-like protein